MIILTFIILCAASLLATLGQAAPADLTDQTFTTAQIITFNPAEANIAVKMTRCKYNAGVTITSSSASPLSGVKFDMTDCTATTLTIATSVYINAGSTFTITRPTLTGVMTASANIATTGVLLIDGLRTTAQLNLLNSKILDGGHLTINDANVATTTANALNIATVAVSGGTLTVKASTIKSTANYGISESALTLTNGVVVFDGLIVSGTHGFYSADYFLKAGSSLTVTGSTFASSTAAN
eukprot:PhF_6_TR15546/c0_g1_i2/m.24166